MAGDPHINPRVPRLPVLSGSFAMSAVVHASLAVWVVAAAPVDPIHVDSPVTQAATVEWEKQIQTVYVAPPPPPEVEPEPEPLVAEAAPPEEPPPRRAERLEEREDVEEEPPRRRRRRRAEPPQEPEREPEAETSPPADPEPNVAATATIPIDDPEASAAESYERTDASENARGPLSDGTASPSLGSQEGSDDGDVAAVDEDGDSAAAGDDGEGEVDVDALLRDYRRTLQRSLRSLVDYPERARRRSMEGTVVVEIRVDQRGHLLEASIFRSSGHPLLDDAVLSAMRAQDRFPPPPGNLEWDGRPIRIPFPFRLS